MGYRRSRNISIFSIYRNSSFEFMVYAINNRDSFENINTWLKEIKYKSNPDIKIILIGNKCDLTEERKVTYAERKTFAIIMNLIDSMNYLQKLEKKQKKY